MWRQVSNLPRKTGPRNTGKLQDRGVPLRDQSAVRRARRWCGTARLALIKGTSSVVRSTRRAVRQRCLSPFFRATEVAIEGSATETAPAHKAPLARLHPGSPHRCLSKRHAAMGRLLDCRPPASHRAPLARLHPGPTPLPAPAPAPTDAPVAGPARPESPEKKGTGSVVRSTQRAVRQRCLSPFFRASEDKIDGKTTETAPAVSHPADTLARLHPPHPHRRPLRRRLPPRRRLRTNNPPRRRRSHPCVCHFPLT